MTANGKLDVSRDGGRSFSALPALALPNGQACCWPGPGPIIMASVLAISPADPNRLYAGLTLKGAAAYQPDLGLWISDDGGGSWRRSGLPLPLAVEGIAITSGYPDTIYAVADLRLWRSMDGGASWAPVKTPPEEVYSVATPTATEVMVGGDDEVGGLVMAGRRSPGCAWGSRRGASTGPARQGMPSWQYCKRPRGRSSLEVVWAWPGAATGAGPGRLSPNPSATRPSCPAGWPFARTGQYL